MSICKSLFCSHLHHQNLVNFIGFSLNPYTLVIEYVPYGALNEFLNKDTSDLGWDLRLKIAVDVAQGMAFMHSLHPSYIHRDLKTPNILV